MRKVKYAIVGQGISGSLLAMGLRNENFIVIDKGSGKDASQIAAGIFNPLTGRKLNKTWMAEELFSQLEPFYRELENSLNASFFYPRAILKPFLDAGIANHVSGKYSSEVYRAFVKRMSFNEGGIPEYIKAEYGYLIGAKGGNVDVPALLSAIRHYLKKHDRLIEAELDYSEFFHNNNALELVGISAEKVIFCEGYKAKENPYFKDLPIIPNKGQILNISSDLSTEYIYNQGFFVLPLSENKFRLGATYDNKAKNLLPDPKSTEELIKKYNNVLSRPFKIISEQCGWRPTVPDRRPLIGKHRHHENLYFFNGFGSKAVTLVPFFASKLVGHLINGEPIPEEVDIRRYYQ